MDFKLSSTQVGAAYGVSSIFGAFNAYTAGQLRKAAYNHQAAMAEINAKMIDTETKLIMADKTQQLKESLAMQNVIAAAQGRAAGGTVSAIQQTSRAALAEEEERLRLQAKMKKVNLLTGAAVDRASGSVAASQGLISGAETLTEGFLKASEYIK